MQERSLFLQSDSAEQNTRFATYRDEAVTHFNPGGVGEPLSVDQKKFLNVIRSHTSGARRGVFLWNVESYLDVTEKPDSFDGPVGTLSCVAAGFKPNMILHTHGFDSSTRIVYFDYSSQALAFRKLLQEEWDGDDYPHFLEYVFRELPSSETFYQLWNDMHPEEMTAHDFEQGWQAELERWGGAQIFKDHWQAYRRLTHEFVHCNILSESDRLFARLGNGPSDVIWWSNAFFTVFSNWFHTLPDRRTIYDVWTRGLSARNPWLHLYGFDYNNIAVNGVQAAEYAEEYFRDGRDYLNPLKALIQIRS